MAKRKASVELNREEFETASTISRPEQSSLDQCLGAAKPSMESLGSVPGYENHLQDAVSNELDGAEQPPSKTANVATAVGVQEAVSEPGADATNGSTMLPKSLLRDEKSTWSKNIVITSDTHEIEDIQTQKKNKQEEPASIFGTLFSKPYTNPFATIALNCRDNPASLDRLADVNPKQDNALQLPHGLFSSNSIFNLSVSTRRAESEGFAPSVDLAQDSGTGSLPSEEGPRPLSLPGEEDEQELFIDFNVIVYQYVPTVVKPTSDGNPSDVGVNLCTATVTADLPTTAAHQKQCIAKNNNDDDNAEDADALQKNQESENRCQVPKPDVKPPQPVEPQVAAPCTLKSPPESKRARPGNAQTCASNHETTTIMKYVKKGEGVLRVLSPHDPGSERLPVKDSKQRSAADNLAPPVPRLNRVRIVARQKGTWRLLLNTPVVASPSYDAVAQVARGWGVRFVALNLPDATTITLESSTPAPRVHFSVFMLKFNTASKRDEFLKVVCPLRQAAAAAAARNTDSTPATAAETV